MASFIPADDPAAVRVEQAERRSDIEAFVAFPAVLNRADRNWVGPLRSEMSKRLDPDRNPFFRHARRRLFLARRGGRVVGTAAAILDETRTDPSGHPVGLFGFFETVDDATVADALLAACGRWLSDAGATVMRGPVNGSTSDERGVLIEGFDTRPAVWEGHNPPYYASLLRTLGFRDQEDVYAYQLTYDDLHRDLGNLPAVLMRAASRARGSGASVRSPTPASWDDDLRIAHELYVRAHATLPGHPGMAFELFSSLANEMRPILDLDLVLLLEVDGQPAGLVFAVPEVYEALSKTSGRGSLFDRARLWWHLRKIRSVSVKVIGVLPEFRKRGLEAMLMVELARRIVANGYDRCDISLVSGSNRRMIALLERLGATVYRRYRVFEVDLPYPTSPTGL